MYSFQNDYHQICHPAVLKKLTDLAHCSMSGYGQDDLCKSAAQLIRKECGTQDASVHFLVGGTQTNLIVIAAALRPHQAVISPKTAHISEHETGAIEATGHKVLELPAEDGKIFAHQIEKVVLDHRRGDGPGMEHSPQPKMVYISQPTELGTLYSLNELKELSNVCRRYGLFLYVDGARLGYGLTAKGNDVQLCDLSRLCDAFYVGGTKLGTAFGEAVVISNPTIAEDFRYMIKQRGGMLAKGWLLGLQFLAMFEDGLYFEIGRHANMHADMIRTALQEAGYPLAVDSTTNQVFTILPDRILNKLNSDFLYTNWDRVDPEHRMVRFCTSWATTPESVHALCSAIKTY